MNFEELKQKNSNHLKQLEEWTELKCCDLLFDSDVDNWLKYYSVLNERIIGKKQLIFLIEDEDGEIFGYYLNTKVTDELDTSERTDQKTFQFNLQSNGRLEKPIKFEIKDRHFGGYILFKQDGLNSICLGNIAIGSNLISDIGECRTEIYFDYNGIENALCGKTWFIPKRIIVVQMV